MNYLKKYENINWEFDEDETPDEINPYSLNLPTYLLVNDILNGYIKSNEWPVRMIEMIGKIIKVNNIDDLNYNDINNNSISSRCYKVEYKGKNSRNIENWWIPFDCMELPINENINWDFDDEEFDNSYKLVTFDSNLKWYEQIYIQTNIYDMNPSIKLYDDYEYNLSIDNFHELTNKQLNETIDNNYNILIFSKKEHFIRVKYNDISDDIKNKLNFKQNENFDWNDEDFLQDETPNEFNPFDLNLPIDMIVNDNLKKYIVKNGWPDEMYNFIGNTYEVIEIKSLGYIGLNNKYQKWDCYYINVDVIRFSPKWWIPFDCMDLF